MIAEEIAAGIGQVEAHYRRPLSFDALHERVEHDFTLHPPEYEAAGQVMDAVRAKFKELAHDVVDRTPASREQSTALTKLEEALFWAIASLARHQ